MSVISYNGIRMQMVKTNFVERQPVLSTDGTTYLYTRWTHDFVALWNPEATSYNQAGDVLVEQAGRFPHVTDAAIRRKLAQPRGEYIWNFGPVDEVMRSPVLGAESDMNHGPVVEDLSVQRIAGVRSWVIHMRITTWLNECPEAPTILSHRFEQSVDVDENHFAVRTTTGEAHFHLPRLAALALEADDYRIKMQHPVPRNFQRTNINVAQNSAGDVIHYSFTDEELPMNFNFANHFVTDIQATQSSSWTSPDLVSVASNVFIQRQMGRNEGRRDALTFSGRGVDGTARGAGARRTRELENLGGRNAMFAAALDPGNLPRTIHAMDVSVQGNRLARRSDLLRVAMSIVASRIQIGYGLISTFEAMADLMGKSINLKVSYSQSALSSISNVVGNTITEIGEFFGINPVDPLFPTGAAAALGPILKDPDNSITTMGVISDDQATINPSPNNAGGTRGTWLEKLVHQSLSEECEPPHFAAASSQAEDTKRHPNLPM